MEKKQEMSYRKFGKTFEQFVWFCEQVSKRKTVEIHAPLYVVMDRKRYEELLRRAYPTDVQIISHD